MEKTKVDPTDSSSIVALAYAVAALQSASVPQEAKEMLENSVLPSATEQCSSQSNTQPPGSGTDSREDRRDDASSMRAANAKGEEEEGGAEKRLARNRERNREHARRTRLRKKAQLEALQSKVKGLDAERQVLKQQIEECSIASILLGLSSGEQDQATLKLLDSTTNHATDDAARSSKVALLAEGKRKRFVADVTGEKSHTSQPLKMNIDGQMTVIGGGGKSHINWKTGIYEDEHGVQKQLTPEQLETLRRERNRMHAKMTRDRKKCFIATIEKTVEELETDISNMKNILAKVSSSKILHHQIVTPMTSPELSPKESPNYLHDDDASSSAYSQPAVAEDTTADNNEGAQQQEPPTKRACHGFSLTD